MNDIKALFDMDIAAWLVGAFLIMSGFNKGIDIIGKFSQSIGKPFKWVKKKNADHDLIEKTKAELDELKKQHNEDTKQTHKEIADSIEETKTQLKQFADNRASDRKQSLQIQKELVDAQKEISEKVDSLKTEVNQRFADGDAKQNKRVQAEIKKDIAQLYRRYNATKQINRMELESLEDLITTYEEHGGENSFVHSKVQVEMYTWKLID